MTKPEEPFVMKVDRPFIFFIGSEQNDYPIVFMGIVADPNKSSNDDG